MPNLSDPTLNDLANISSEEYYEEMFDFSDDFENLDDDCPDWVMEQIDEELPF